jgi:hypothetical protein
MCILHCNLCSQAEEEMMLIIISIIITSSFSSDEAADNLKEDARKGRVA